MVRPRLGYTAFDVGGVEVLVSADEDRLDDAPDIAPLFRAVRLQPRARGRRLVAFEVRPGDVRYLLGSFCRLHYLILDALPGAVPLWDGVEIRANERLGSSRYMPIFECLHCAGGGCAVCGSTGEIRGF